MDSGGNSGSMQSSSTGGGDEPEYDSSSHAFFHVGGGGGGSGVGGGGNSLQQQQQSSLFDSLSNFLTNDNHNNNTNPFSTPLSSSSAGRSNQNPSSSSSSLLNLDILLQNPSSNTIPRSHHQLNNFNSLMTSSSPSPQLPHLGRVNSQNPSLPMNSTDHPQANINNPPNRNPKKRSRASRRAPTTVLTTDTSNFRAMVQEFTGIPVQPFTSTSSLLFPRSNRFDLFSNSNTTSTVRSGNDSSYLLRPFAQKPVQVPPFLSSNSSVLLNSNTSTANTSTSTAAGTANPNVTSSSSTNSFQLLSDQLGLSSKNNQSLLNMQSNNNPSLIPYQSLLLQSNPGRNENNDHTRTISSGGSVGLPNLVTSDGLISTMRNASSSWEDQNHLLRSLNGNYNNGNNSSRHHQQHQQRVIMNADKGTSASNNNQNVSTATRGEGMVDSWICSSE